LSSPPTSQTNQQSTLPKCENRSPNHRQNRAITDKCARLIPKADRKAIHEYLFREGVLVAKKDFNQPKHGDIDTKNLYVCDAPRRNISKLCAVLTIPLQVIKACQSLTSRGYLKTQFSWQWYYYTLTPEGLDYLREWLHLPAEIVPQTHVKQQRSHAPPRGMLGGDGERRGGGRGGPRGDREGGYRRREDGEKKEGGAPGNFNPEFSRGGFGRGRGAAPSS
jgi:small subunit ribosomal protein S10e